MGNTALFNHVYRKTIGVVLLVLAMVGAGAGAGAGSGKAAVGTAATARREIQLSQARDLLGARGEVVAQARARDLGQVDSFVRAYVKREINARWKGHAARAAQAVLTESQRHGFDPLLLLAMIQNESKFNPSVIGSHGEIGLMQILPTSGEWIARRARIKWQGAAALHDPAYNIRLGAAYLAMLRAEFGFHKDLYISAYNMGSANVRRLLSGNTHPRTYTSKTVKHYSGIYAEFVGAAEVDKPSKRGSQALAAL